MTTHLTPEDFVSALDDSAAAPFAGHLASCHQCRDQLDELRTQLRALAGVDVPEPSPLFWDHFARRVRAATTLAPAPAAATWAPRRFVWTMGVAATLGLVAVLTWSYADAPGGRGDEPVFTVDTAPVAFDDVSTALAEIDPEDADVFAPGSAATWAMVDDLTDAERAAFVRLLERELEALP